MKKNTKSIIAVILCLILTAAAFTACGKKGETGESTTLSPDESWAPGGETYQPVTITDVELAEIVKEALGDDADDFNGDLSSLSSAQLSKVKQTAALNGYIVTKDEDGKTVIQKDNIGVTEVESGVYDEIISEAGLENGKKVTPSQYDRVSRKADEMGATAVTNKNGDVTIIQKDTTAATTRQNTTTAKNTNPNAQTTATTAATTTKKETPQSSPTTRNIQTGNPGGGGTSYQWLSTTAAPPTINIIAVNKEKGLAYGNGPHAILSKSVMDSNGNVYAVGSTLADAKGKAATSSSGLIVKFGDSKIEWSKIIDGQELTAFNDVAILKDGSIIAVGDTLSSSIVPDSAFKCKGTVEGLICKFSAAGKLQWTKIFGGSQSDIIYAITPTSDGGFLIGGKTTSSDFDLKNTGSGKVKAFISKMDADGGLKWVESLSGTKHNSVYDLEISQDGSIYAAIESICNDGDYKGLDGADGARRYSVIGRFSSNGKKQWLKSFYEGGSVIIKNICTFGNDVVAAGYYTAGRTGVNSGSFKKLYNGGQGGTYDGIVLKVNAEGGTVWQTPLIGFQNDYVTGIVPVSGGFAVSGYTSSTNRDFAFDNKGETDSFVYMISSGGTTLCANSVGGSRADRALGICGSGYNVAICGGSVSSDADFANVGAKSDGENSVAFNYRFSLEKK